MNYCELIDIALLQQEPIENGSVFVCEDRRLGELRFNNIPPDLISAKERNDVIPGRGDLRISLTSACNLRCSYCHNEGQEAPWLQAKTSAMLGNIGKLLEIAGKHGVKSVKFSGGDPGVYPGFFMLMDAIALWRERYPGIQKWGICTNGGPFLAPKKFEALVASRLNNISIGIDSVEPGEPSKPSSPVGVSGKTLVDEFVVPLLRHWSGRSIKFDTIFTGDKCRALNVVRAARRLGDNASAAIGVPLSAKVCGLVAFLFVALSGFAGCTAWRQPNGMTAVATSTTGATSYAPFGKLLAPAANPQIRNVGIARPAGSLGMGPSLLRVADTAASISPMVYKAPPATALPIIAPPEFTPWPPPRPSSYYLYPESFLQPFRNRPTGDLLEDIQRRTEEAGYPPGSLFSVPAGFAFALPLERIDDKGYPRTINRWVTDTRWFAPENIVEVILRIFIRRIDHYRQFIFVLTSDGSQSKKYPESFDRQQELSRDGHLFYDFSTMPVTASSHLYVLIYEYSVEKQDEPKLLTASQVLGRDHLSNSKILSR
jgi:Radical SAM superfamily/4Fe-4S single cluster domain